MMDLILALNMFCSNQFSAFHRAHCQQYMNKCTWMVKAPDFIQMYKICASEYAKVPDPRKKDKAPAKTLPKQTKKPGGHALDDLSKK